VNVTCVRTQLLQHKLNKCETSCVKLTVVNLSWILLFNRS